MASTSSQKPETQRTFWNDAVGQLGGIRATASALGCNERTVRGLCSGERDLHDGWLRDIAKALIDKADNCRTLERKLSPAFAGNLTDRQADEQMQPRHNWRRDHHSKGAR